MNTSMFIGIIFVLLGLISAALLKTGYALPFSEVKRRANRHEPDSHNLYELRSYGSSLKLTFWIYQAVTLGVGFSLIAKNLALIPGAIVLSALILWFFLYLPKSPVNRLDRSLTKMLMPPILWKLSKIEPLLIKMTKLANSLPLAEQTSELYDRQDIIDLIARQKKQPDNQISTEELDRLKKVLTIEQKTIGDILTPKNKVKALLASDTIGPILIDDIHKSHQSFVLVKDTPKGDIVGTLAFKDLSIHSKGEVKDHMNKSICYLNENDPVSEIFRAFVETNQYIFVVVNGLDEYVGVATIHDGLKAALGKMQTGEFSSYELRQAVVERYAKPEDLTETAPTPTVKTDQEVIE